MKLEPRHLTAIVDTREQRPLRLEMPTVRGTLQTGDYTIRGLEGCLLVERKELSDLIGCMTSGRDRFERELARMRGCKHRLVVVEADWRDLAEGNYRSRLDPKAATHTVTSWMSRHGTPFLFTGDRDRAADAVSHFLFSTAKRIVSTLAELTGGCIGPETLLESYDLKKTLAP